VGIGALVVLVAVGAGIGLGTTGSSNTSRAHVRVQQQARASGAVGVPDGATVGTVDSTMRFGPGDRGILEPPPPGTTSTLSPTDVWTAHLSSGLFQDCAGTDLEMWFGLYTDLQATTD
jgi:hypothetical protein